MVKLVAEFIHLEFDSHSHHNDKQVDTLLENRRIVEC